MLSCYGTADRLIKEREALETPPVFELVRLVAMHYFCLALLAHHLNCRLDAEAKVRLR